MTPVRHIWAVGRNYIDHAKEMNAEVPKQPLFFLKGGGTLTTEKKLQFPAWAQSVHHEIEIALKISKNQGSFKFSHMALALDLTERHFQSEAKKRGEPWTLSKSFIGSCPVSDWVPYQENGMYSFHLKINGEVRQQGTTNQMIFSPAQLLSFATTHFPVEDGDILLSGTPSGVGPLRSQDQLHAALFGPHPASDLASDTAAAKAPILTCNWVVA